MERVIVTGANGFIGKKVTERLLDISRNLFSIDRRGYAQDTKNVVQIVADLSMGNAIDVCSEKIKHADVMVHLAADISVPGDASTIGNNIAGMRSALEIARKTGVRHFIFLSSIPIIGDILYTPIDENHRVMPKTLYHWSKYLCEQMLDKYRGLFETTAIIRIPSPIGVGMRSGVYLSVLLSRMRNNEDVEIYGHGTRMQNYIDVRDVAQAILNMIETKSDGLYLIAGEKSISNLQLAKMCKEIIGSGSSIRIGVHEDLEEAEQWIISYDKAAKSFGYRPSYSLEESIRDIFKDMNGKLNNKAYMG